MGNCQATAEASAIVIEYPDGKEEKLYLATNVTVGDVMKKNPGYHLCLVIPGYSRSSSSSNSSSTVRLARVKLLRPYHSLLLGCSYRLVPSQEVMEVVRAKKYVRMNMNETDKSQGNPQNIKSSAHTSQPENDIQMLKQERHRLKISCSENATTSKIWRPSLHSISEGGSR